MVTMFGMVQGAGGLGFLNEAPLALGIGDLVRGQHLDGDDAVEMRVAGLVDDAHAAFAELRFDSCSDRASGRSPESLHVCGYLSPCARRRPRQKIARVLPELPSTSLVPTIAHTCARRIRVASRSSVQALEG